MFRTDNQEVYSNILHATDVHKFYNHLKQSDLNKGLCLQDQEDVKQEKVEDKKPDTSINHAEAENEVNTGLHHLFLLCLYLLLWILSAKRAF